ncbi:MAG: tetratricopeptide repeat protein, partial [Alphaproteobacteria bacterium]|nr:tetratricopeptide repeat protein [Alphaproteobacteria bacterium]
GVYRKILVRDPGNLQAEAQLALAQLHARDYAGAARGAERLLERLPDRAALQNLLGAAQRAMGHHERAAAAFRQAIALEPSFPDAYNNLGATLVATGAVAEAIPAFERAIELAPSRLAARINLVEALVSEQDYEKAVSVMAPLAERAPNDPRVLMNRYALATRTCDWAALPALTAQLDTALAAALTADARPAETPFTNVARKADPEQNLAVARAWSAAIAARAATEEPKSHQRAKSADQRLRIGYLSGDFRDHPVARLLGGLFGRHDRSAFHVTAYTHGTNDGSRQRRRLGTDCDSVVDLNAMSDPDAAGRIAADGTDILVDLMGHTGGNRLGIAARRPAAVQAVYLGFPGSTGADFIDYVLTDRVVTPPDGAPWCSEQPVYLPHCYQANDRDPVDAKSDDRAAHGLPADGIVFSSFNQLFKLEPVMTKVWMAILDQVPGSVLWLSGGIATAEANLRRFAEAEGIDADRLHFAPRVPFDAHLTRLRLADLGLDTRIYNGHTTTSDLLWMGVPVIALRGTHFASRVAASILTTHGLPELIADSLDDYRDLAIGLARDPAKLQAMKARVAENRTTTPLFDGQRFVQGLEQAYREMWAIHEAGEAPRPIDLSAGPD